MNEKQVRMRVGVIGAGFAGLAVCRALALTERAAKAPAFRLFEVVVFDEKSPPSDEETPSRGAVLIGEEGLRLLEQLRVNLHRQDFPQEWQRVELLQVLSQEIEENIHYSERVISIAEDEESGSAVVLTSKNKLYHFDLIIAADGLASPTRNIACSDPVISHKVLLTGDARCQYRSEFLCGYSRIRYGITNALNDAVMIVKILKESICNSSWNYSCIRTVQSPTYLHSEYSVSSWKIERGRRFMVVLCSIASIAAVLIGNA